MRIGFARKYSVEIGMASAFNELGHKCFFFQKHPDKFVNWVKTTKLNLLFCMSSSHIPSSDEITSFRKIGCRVIYWERAAKRKNGVARRFDKYFTIYDDNSGIYLPCAATDHGKLKREPSLGVTLIAAKKHDSKAWGKCRASLHKKIDKEINRRYTVYGNIPYKSYDSRFNIMAKSLMSIAIWNTYQAVPLRMIEVPSCRTPLISYPFPIFRKLFIPGQHYIETQSLSDSLDYYLCHKDELDEIALNGYKHFKGHHTYIHRAHQILEELKCA